MELYFHFPILPRGVHRKFYPYFSFYLLPSIPSSSLTRYPKLHTDIIDPVLSMRKGTLPDSVPLSFFFSSQTNFGRYLDAYSAHCTTFLQGVSGGLVHILGNGIMNYSE